MESKDSLPTVTSVVLSALAPFLSDALVVSMANRDELSEALPVPLLSVGWTEFKEATIDISGNLSTALFAGPGDKLEVLVEELSLTFLWSLECYRKSLALSRVETSEDKVVTLS